MHTYTEVELEKKVFVENELFNLLKHIDSDIQQVTYETNGIFEVVTVTYAKHSSKYINVTGDSLKALTQDVLKKI